MQPDNKLRDEEVVQLTAVYNEVEANLIRSLLDDAGIETVVVTQVPRSVYPLTIDGLGEIKIKVLASQLADAQQLLEESCLPDMPDVGLDYEEL